MRRDSKTLLFVLGLAIAASALYLSHPWSSSQHDADSVAAAPTHSDPAPAERPTATEAAPARAPLVAPAASNARDARNTRDTVLPDEATIMAQLRELGDASPLESLALAREGNEYFPSGNGAPQRHWIIVKSLENLQRFHEARDEAQSMVDRYPTDALALDVKRHVLVYPLDQPSREEQQRNEL